MSESFLDAFEIWQNSPEFNKLVECFVERHLTRMSINEVLKAIKEQEKRTYKKRLLIEKIKEKSN